MDVISALTDSVRPRKYWNDLKTKLRKSGLQQKIYEVPYEKIYKIYTGITDLKYQFPYLNNEEVREKIEKMQSDFLDVYNNKEDGNEDGNNENMGN